MATCTHANQSCAIFNLKNHSNTQLYIQFQSISLKLKYQTLDEWEISHIYSPLTGRKQKWMLSE